MSNKVNEVHKKLTPNNLLYRALGRKYDGGSGESAREYLRRMMDHSDFEIESTFDQLTVAGVLAYWEMLAEYDVDFLSDVIECVEEGDSPDVYNAWRDKYAPHLDRLTAAQQEVA